MKIHITSEASCETCFYNSNQCRSKASGYCQYEKATGGQNDFFVESDHYCKRHTLTDPTMPTTLADAIAACEDRLENISENDNDTEMTVADVIAEHWDTPNEAIRIAFDHHPVLDWKIHIKAEWECRRGDGWGAYSGPTPDEYSGHIAIAVLDAENVTIFSDEGSDEEVNGSHAGQWIREALEKTA